MLLLLAASRGWTTTQLSLIGSSVADLARAQQPDYNESREGFTGRPVTPRFVWHMPAMTADRRGLGGGIAYVVDEARLCALDVGAPTTGSISALFDLQPRASCAQIVATIKSALDAWSEASPAVRFVDVTKECIRRHGTVEPNCSLAELTFTTFDLATDTFDVAHEAIVTAPHSSRGWPLSPTNSAEWAVHCRGLGVFAWNNDDCEPQHSFVGYIEHFAAQWLGIGVPGVLQGVKWYPDQTLSYNPTGFGLNSPWPTFGCSGLEQWNASLQHYDSGGRRLQWFTPEDGVNTQTATTRVYRHHRETWDHALLRRPDGGVFEVATWETYAATVGVGVPSTGWGWCLPETNAHCAAVHVDALGLQLIVAGSVLALVLGAALASALLSRTAPAAASGIGAGGVAAGIYLAIAMHVTLVAPCGDATVLVAPKGCLDLRTAFLHEIGLALGLGSPDANAIAPYSFAQPPEWHTFHLDPSLASLEDVAAATEACRNPWAHTREGVPAGVETVTLDDWHVVRPSVMLESKPSRWLTEDDVEAINVLYNQCDLGSATASQGVPHDPVLNDAEGKLTALTNHLVAQAALLALIVGGASAAVAVAVRAMPPPAVEFAQVSRATIRTP